MTWVVVLALVAGCQPFTPRQTGPLQPGTASLFSDIPVPRGFTYEPSKSFSDLGRGYRTGQLLFSGNAAVEDVVQFYKEQMPANSWTEERNLRSSDNVAMYFKKGEERSTITIKAGGVISSTTIKIEVR
jgi:hypothetical protein